MLEIRKGGHKDLERVYSVFEIDFDKKELLPRLGVHLAISKGDMELLIVYDEESQIEVAYALAFCRGLYGYVLLKYLSVLPWYRGKGAGIQAMRLLNKRYEGVQGILAELTVFDPEDDGSTLRKLRKFFSRFGYEPVDSDYRLAGAEVELMVKPVKGTAEIGPVAHRIIRDFYSRVLGPTSMERTIDIRRKG
ncbi:MAG: hypothetical protein IK095_06350 [Oscillospiraceae bacterium]|nr:hypothetical protein [Oscillospiraceae bacterium]